MRILPEWEPIVSPQPRYDETRPVIAITAHAILTEAGDLWRDEPTPRESLRRIFKDSPPSLVACDRALPVLAELAELFADDPRFQFEIFSMPKEAYNPEWQALGVRAVTETLVVNRVGLRVANRGQKGLWHLLLDCVDMTGGIPEALIQASTRVDALMKWGCLMRKLVREFDLRVRPTNGGIASQLLRSRRFYPDARRRVPRQTNASCRPGLRGNHYDYSQLDPATTYVNVLEIDQRNAHHFAAATVELPHSDSLYARGSFQHPEKPVRGTGWLHGSRGFEREISRCGMFLVELHKPRPKVRFAPSFLMRDERPVLICSNEIPHLEAIGWSVYRLIASWTGDPEPPDRGISAYAEYCLALSEATPPAEWAVMKRTLLTLYGMLGATEKQITRYYRQSRSDLEPTEIKVGAHSLSALASKPRATQPFTANVVQRAMIEAETAWCSINLANSIDNGVLAIYADAIYVQTDAPPLLAAPWRIKNEMATATFPKPAVVIGTTKSGKPIRKIPGGLRREIETAEARAPWRNALDNSVGAAV